MDDDPVLLEVKGGVAVLTLNRPARHNAIGDAMDALFFRYLDLVRNDRDVRVVVWRGAGESFSVGRDMAELAGAEPDESGVTAGGTTRMTPPWGTPRVNGSPAGRAAHGFGPSDFEVLDRAHWGARALADFPVPIICALKGWTLGTAFERALLCDVRIAGEGTGMALSGIDHGLIPDAGGLAKLHEIGGSGLALDLGLTGRRVTADDALRLGLVSEVVPDDEVDEVAHERARRVVERPPLVVRMVREHVQALSAPGVRATLGREVFAQTLVLSSHDFDEHHRARAEDREPRFEHR